MPYGFPRTDDERTAMHLSIYGEEPPVVRLGNAQSIYPSEMPENLNLILLTGALFAGWIFVDFIIPRLMDK
jgi:hypothetical protein